MLFQGKNKSNTVYTEFVLRLKFVEKDLTQLESAKEEAELYLKQRDKVALCKHSLYHKYLFDLKRDRSGVDENLEALKTDIGKIEQQSEEVYNVFVLLREYTVHFIDLLFLYICVCVYSNLVV